MNIPAAPDYDLPVDPSAPAPVSAAATSLDHAGEFEALHSNALWGFRVGQCFLAGALWIPLLIISLAILTPRLGGAAAGGIAIGMLVLLMLWSWALAKRRYLAVRFLLDRAGLTICRGVYWQSETHIARSRVQHTDIQRGPLDRRLGLADLLVHTAGTSMATVRLSGLSVERAQSLRDALLEGHDQRF